MRLMALYMKFRPATSRNVNARRRSGHSGHARYLFGLGVKIFEVSGVVSGAKLTSLAKAAGRNGDGVGSGETAGADGA